ncbi:hypothetical protein Plhal304r1_c059g0147731 [Plasmopara halstedii]
MYCTLERRVMRHDVARNVIGAAQGDVAQLKVAMYYLITRLYLLGPD